MNATQLALGIFFGFGSLEVFKAVVASIYEANKRNAMKRDLVEVADDFIDKMHRDLMADREAEEAKKAPRRKPAVKKAPAKKPVAKSLSQQRREAVMKSAKKGGKK